MYWVDYQHLLSTHYVLNFTLGPFGDRRKKYKNPPLLGPMRRFYYGFIRRQSNLQKLRERQAIQLCGSGSWTGNSKWEAVLGVSWRRFEGICDMSPGQVAGKHSSKGGRRRMVSQVEDRM